MNNTSLITGNVKKRLLAFVLPYLLACFLQTFYGMADLFVVGLYNGSETTTAVAIGSQVMHMLTVMMVGLAMGATVEIGRAVGGGDAKRAKEITGVAGLFFGALALVLTAVLLVCTPAVTGVMMTPAEAVPETARYLTICFAGLPFIIAYNVLSSVYRGAGDSRSPMVFVAIACGLNLALDFLFIGAFHLGAAGAALATVIAQGFSSLVSALKLRRAALGFTLGARDFRWRKRELKSILSVGLPICFQDGLIQVAFLIITIIANSRGLIASSAVGIVEKVISFLFLVPSAFLAAISAFTAQNMGAGKRDRARQSLYFGLAVTVAWGLICVALCHLMPGRVVGLFTRDPAVIAAGSVYLLSYSFDVVFAAVHFCFSGYFCGDQKSGISFLHNLLSILICRIPGAYLASLYFPDSLYPMGLAAPAGSLLSALICLGFYLAQRKKERI